MIKILLVEPAYVGNIGSVCRVMKNFGFEQLVIVNPQCNHLSSDAFRLAKHADDILSGAKVVKKIPKYDVLIGTTAKVYDDYNVRRSPLLPGEIAAKLKGISSTKTIGIVFGREARGLTNKELDRCDMTVTIEASAAYPSLNLSHAVAILLHELFTVSSARVRNAIPFAEKKEIRQIDKMINAVIDAGFASSAKQKVQRLVWKNVFHKAMLTKREAFGVMGLLRRIMLILSNRKLLRSSYVRKIYKRY